MQQLTLQGLLALLRNAPSGTLLLANVVGSLGTTMALSKYLNLPKRAAWSILC